MSDYQPDYIEYRLSKAKEALATARLLADNKSWNACVNRLYYACYYAVSSLLLKNGITTQTHNGVKTQFNLLFVKTGIVDKDLGRLYADLLDSRLKGDYGDLFDFDMESVEPLISPTQQFIDTVTILINP